jgi:dTDP-4-amino-4,6-dideoxygalactose transaminase
MTVPPQIPQNDPGASYLAYQAELDAAWQRVMHSGRYVLGDEVAAFEHEFAAYAGVPHGVGVASGTDALQIALRAVGVASGDLVLTVSHTAVATAAAIVLCGARPVFVDIDPGSFTMDPSRLEGAIRRHRAGGRAAAACRAKAIVPVHLYGHPADMRAICDIARRYDLRVVEDCAQAHGASLGGRKVGAWGDAAAFSFYPTKNLGTFGDGGMIVTADSAIAATCRALREYGWDTQRTSRRHGLNSRLDELHAALLRVRLAHLDDDNRRRAAIAAIYHRLLDRKRFGLPTVRSRVIHVYHQYVIRTRNRDVLRNYLSSNGITTAIHYPQAVHQQPAFPPWAPDSMPELRETERAVAEILSLPMYPQFSLDWATRVADCCNACADSFAGPSRGRGQSKEDAGSQRRTRASNQRGRRASAGTNTSAGR